MFPSAANGSLIEKDGKAIGSRLIGQPFDDPKYFWSRPSATGPYAYNAGASSGSNLGPTEPGPARCRQGPRRQALEQLIRLKQDRRPDRPGHRLRPAASIRTSRPRQRSIRCSASPRRAGCTEDDVRKLVEQHIEPRTLGMLGEPRVNVLLLNLALDDL